MDETPWSVKGTSLMLLQLDERYQTLTLTAKLGAILDFTLFNPENKVNYNIFKAEINN
nr:hypothetical protein [Nostoc sp. FACHB-152]